MKQRIEDLSDEYTGSIDAQSDTITVLTTVANMGEQRKLAKTFELVDGELEERSTEKPKYYTYSQRTAAGIRDFANQLDPIFSDPNSCIIRGDLIVTKNSNKRITRTKVDDMEVGKVAYFESNLSGKRWICVDFDEIDNPNPKSTKEDMLKHLVSLLGPEFEDTTYLYHWSSSAGLDGWKTISAHLYFWLEERRTDAEMRQWAVSFNKKAGVKIVDEALFDCIQAHYIADPIFEDGIRDPIQGPRAGLIEGARDCVSLPAIAVPATTQNSMAEIASKANPHTIAKGGINVGGTKEATIAEILEPLRAIRRIKEPSSCGWRQDWRDAWYSVACILGPDGATGLLNQAEFFPEQKVGEYDELSKGFTPDKSGFNKLDEIASRLDPMYQSSKSHLENGSAISSYRLTHRVRSGLLIKYLNAGCGEGKSYQMLADIVMSKSGIWLYSVDKITSIDERIKEIKKYCREHNMQEPEIRKAHLKMHEEDLSKKLPVGKQIGLIRNDIDCQEIEFCIVFITHKALLMRKWGAWKETRLVIDEAPDVFKSGQLHLKTKLSRDFVKGHFKVLVDNDGDCYELELSEDGEQAASSIPQSTKPDKLTKVLEDMLEMSQEINGKLYVKAHEWDDQESDELSWFGFISPEFLRPFDGVWMLGDALEETEVFKLWQDLFMVKWLPEKIKNPRKWIVPIAKRSRIKCYDAHRKASLTRFNDPDETVLNKIRIHISNDRVPIGFWTTNEALRLKGFTLQGEYIEPKAHGRNDLIHHTSGAYFAAIQPSGFEEGLLKQVCGMTPDELVVARHCRPLLQHTMRGVLRDPESEEFFEQHVYSMFDALYLQSRLGSDIELVEGVIVSEPPKPGAKPDLGSKMSQKERNDRKELIKKGLTEDQSIEALLMMRFEKCTRKQAEQHFTVINKVKRIHELRVNAT